MTIEETVISLQERVRELERRTMNLETTVKDIATLTVSVERLTVNISNMVDQQKITNERLSKLESEPSDMMRQIKTGVIIALITAAITAFICV